MKTILGLVGWPLRQSLSPAIHRAALEALGLQGEYRLCPIPPLPAGEAALKSLFSGVRGQEWRGLNLTIPHKRSVLPFLDELTPLAQAVGAVNIVFLREQRLVGDNTDVTGFRTDLTLFLNQGGENPRRYVAMEKALILGAGGAARAAAFALSEDGWRVTVAARGLSQAQQLVDDLRFCFPERSQAFGACPLDLPGLQIALPCDLIVNATPVGMPPDVEASPWPPGLAFPPGAALYDLVYFPEPTSLVRSARAAGLRAATGVGMLVEQAALAFERWFELPAPRTAMMAAALSALNLER